MRTPRRWMALAAAIAILTIALLPTTGVAAPGGIKLFNPPNEESFGDPDTPIGPVIVPLGNCTLVITTKLALFQSGAEVKRARGVGVILGDGGRNIRRAMIERAKR